MTVDMSGASDADFRARIAPIENGEAAEEACVEKVARAMWSEMRHEPWTYAEFRAEDGDYRRLARAAIDALRGPVPGDDPAAGVDFRQLLADLTESVSRGDEYGLPEAYRAAAAALRGTR